MTLMTVTDLSLDVPDMSHASVFGRRRKIRILTGVSLSVERGEILGIVGESGSGKTSLGRSLLRLNAVSEGKIRFDGIDITHLGSSGLLPFRRRMQMIFQDPQSSLNPRLTIGRSLRKVLQFHGRDASDTALSAVLERVALPSTVLARYPHQLSGGQRQRVGIARAIALGPEFVVADEIVSGLDASTQAQIIMLLKQLCADMGLSLVFISHDLSVIRYLCDRVLILRNGQIVEEGKTSDIFNAPRETYTRDLIDAIPLPEPDANWLA